MHVTLSKFNLALKGEMINLMTEIFSDSIKNKLKNDNLSEKKNIYEIITNKFINEYKSVLRDEDLKNYIIKMIGDSFFSFYKNYNKKISTQLSIKKDNN